MKLNFWQWLGVVLLIVGVAYYIYDHRDKSTPPAKPVTPATTQP
jgi:hypothetical protein